jgi:homoserine O-acetyltransferase
MSTVSTFEVPEFTLENGGRLAPARLVYGAYGRLSPARDNAIVFPTAFGGRHVDNEWLIGPGLPLDTDRYFVIVPNLLGNGVSSSPSNYDGSFPPVTIRDNVRFQKQLVDHLGVRRLALVVGYSMGGQQAYEWAASYPEMVARLACLCGAARTSPWQSVFLGGMRALLALHDGATPAEPRVVEALARVWAPWGLCAAFYDEGGYRAAGHDDQELFIRSYWVERLTTFRAADLAAMLDTWQSHDLATRGDGASLEEVLGRISCPTLLIQSTTDQYFRLDYAVRECELLPNARLVELDSVWGHVAGRGRVARDAAAIGAVLREHLNRGSNP